jgi:hypothetical protein
MRMTTRVAGIIVTTGAVAALAVTSATGTPARLPAIALGSNVLFHLERLVALLAGFVALLAIVTRAWSGQLPSEVSTAGVKYAAEETRATTSDAARATRDELQRLSARLERLEERG